MNKEAAIENALYAAIEQEISSFFRGSFQVKKIFVFLLPVDKVIPEKGKCVHIQNEGSH